MGQKRIQLDLTEYEARVLRWAVLRARHVAPRKLRTRMFEQKLSSLATVVDTATESLAPLPGFFPPAARKSRS